MAGPEGLLEKGWVTPRGPHGGSPGARGPGVGRPLPKAARARVALCALISSSSPEQSKSHGERWQFLKGSRHPRMTTPAKDALRCVVSFSGIPVRSDCSADAACAGGRGEGANAGHRER